MSEADVVYADVRFTKTKENAKAVSQVPGERSKVSERAALVVLSVLLAAAVVGLGLVSYDNLSTKNKVNSLEKSSQSLKTEYEALNKSLTDKLQSCITMKPIIIQPTEVKLNDSCHKCETDWEEYGGTCYYFSNTTSTWNQSRAECKRVGGDLVQIHSIEEQAFLELRVRKKMNDDEDKFWIGLTDAKEEGRWLWVDDSPLNTSLSFWIGNEPDNWKVENPDGENCARMGEKGGAVDLKCWMDKSCNAAQRRICEKPAETAQYRLTCPLKPGS